MLNEKMRRVRRFARFAAQQRCGTVRSKYKRPSGVDPTILVNVQETEPPETDDAGERRVVSFTAALARYLDRPRSSAASSAASAPPALSRDTYLLLPGDLMFVEAGGR